jgi:hypothetical protein
MSTDIRKPPTEVSADLRAAVDHAFKRTPLDPDVARRIEARAEAIRQRLPITNVAVDLIRESRDDV